ncbi:hypothetical protein M3223_02630 [Paenibacillus pasadenensis]|uniref:hypothetical protein n=1 Tax=Paenibacillus pasadenensis TaxID=217090 RepID=UPI0020415876|nr:hypothetical protein [Paenibacillus pasadenensis]MCM3746244.1 hypothetical protein [Paenibacillus pasadenensis]
MRLTMVFGWAIAPFVMLPVSWKQLSAPAKTWGAVWTFAMLLALAYLFVPLSQGNPAQKVQAKIVPAVSSPSPQASPGKSRT